MIERLQEIRERLEKATPGPWQTRFMYRMFKALRELPGFQCETAPESDWADADMCAHAPDDIAALLPVVEASLKRRDARKLITEWQRENERRLAPLDLRAAMLAATLEEDAACDAFDTHAAQGLRPAQSEARDLVSRFLAAMRWWGAQEDGIPAELARLYCDGKAFCGHEYAQDSDMLQAAKEYKGTVTF